MKYSAAPEQKETHYYFLQGPFLAYTSNEELLKQVLDHKKQNGADVAPATALHLKKTASAQAVASLWINPRALDGELLKKPRV